MSDLKAMRERARALRATGGGDCPEFGMSGIQNTFRARHAEYDIDAMTPGSQMIVITDAYAKDKDLTDAVIAEAKSRQVCIHLLLSTSGCGGDFSSYVKVAAETGGTVVRGNSRYMDNLIEVFGEFSTSYKDSPCAEFYSGTGGGLMKRNLPMFARLMSDGQCHTFRVSVFVDILKVLITTDQPRAIFTKPSGETVDVDVFSGYATYRKVRPEPGEWSVCVESGTFAIQFNSRFLIDFVVRFVEKDDSTPSGLNATSIPPPACKPLITLLYTTMHNVVTKYYCSLY